MQRGSSWLRPKREIIAFRSPPDALCLSEDTAAQAGAKPVSSRKPYSWHGNIAVIAAGTGLGQAILYWDGEKHQPMATEGGHTDFAPQTIQQVEKHFNARLPASAA
jgi:glucokinase